MEPAAEHVLNMDRQRCRGATLVVTEAEPGEGPPLILGVNLCQHSGGELSRCCRKIQVVTIPKIDPAAMERAMEAARSKRKAKGPAAPSPETKFAKISGRAGA